MGNRFTIVATLLGMPSLMSCSSIEYRPEVAARIEEISEDRLRTHVEELCAIGPRSSADEAATAATLAYLESELTRLGYRPRREVFQDTVIRRTVLSGPDGSKVNMVEEVEDGLQVNLIAEIPGSERPNAVVEVCAHYDSVIPSPGADDNASGVAGLLELARVLRNTQPQKTIRFCFFAAEEPGLQGSTAHVAAMTESEREQFVALIDLEMIGYTDMNPGSQTTPVNIPFFSFPDTADFVAVIGTFRSGWLGNSFEDAIDRYVPDLPYYSANRIGGFFKDARRSDHAPYWDAQLPAIMVTDTSEFRNPHYHRALDMPDTLDYSFMRRVTMATAATVLHLAGPED